MRKIRNTTHRFLIGLMALALFALPLALPPGAGAQSSKTFFEPFASASRGTTTASVINLTNVPSTGLVSFLDVTAQTGTNPTLDVVIQDGYTSTGPWSTLITFTQVTAATGNQVIAASRAPNRFLRPVATVGGTSTPKFTFTLHLMTYNAAALAVTTSQVGAATYTQWTLQGNNGATLVYGVNTELLTLATGATTTDTTGNLLPARSIIDSVTGEVTTLITTAVSWGLGDPTTAARFTATNAGAVTLGATLSGLDHWSGAVSTLATGPSQASAAKVRVTTNANPGAGVVRIVVFYHQVTAPTS